ncbi:MAG: hypothetical protein M3209_11255 [Acidobacteriota bacterium]|nr:hypothetical protein [Acidobacteriota bacterium]
MNYLKAFCLILFLCVCLHAQQRPLITEDVDIIESGAVRIGTGVEFLQNAKFPLSGLKGDLTRVGVIDLEVGFAPNVQLEISGTIQNFLAINSQTRPAPIPLAVSPTGNSANDIGDFGVAAKIKLRNETENFPSIGFKFGFQIPNTNQARGIGTNQNNIFALLLAGKKFGKTFPDRGRRFNAYGNLGIAILPAPLEAFTQNDVLLYGLAGSYRVNNRFNIVSEVNGRVNTRSGRAPLGTESLGEFRLGTQIRASGLKFDAAAILGLTRYSPRSGVTFGVTYESPSIFTPAK